jgi:6-pyruvoyltetrahydropterin/6-carboxytetrahydropterin synthase
VIKSPFSFGGKIMYSVTVIKTFSASHQLREYDGPCSSLHGHNFKVVVEVSSEKLDDRGMVVDFVELDEALSEIVDKYDHKNLNMVFPYDRKNPTAENMAEVIYHELNKKISLENAKLFKVTIFETDEYFASYQE